MRTGRALQPGDYVIWSAFLLGHVADVPLTRRGFDTVSKRLRRFIYLVMWLDLGWHVWHPQRYDRYDWRWHVGKRLALRAERRLTL